MPELPKQYQCDRCCEIMESRTRPFHIPVDGIQSNIPSRKYPEFDGFSSERDFDLCKSCEIALVQWMADADPHGDGNRFLQHMKPEALE